jgi:hypothetical protein
MLINNINEQSCVKIHVTRTASRTFGTGCPRERRVKCKEYCLFIIFNIILLSRSNAQIDSRKLFNEIQTKCDSLLNHEKQQSPKIASYLIFLINLKLVNGSEGNVIISYIFNYSELKYYHFNYITSNNDCIILYDLNASFEDSSDLYNLEPFNKEDTMLLKSKLKNEPAWIFYHGKPMQYKIQNDCTLNYQRKEEDFIDNPHLLPPMKIERLKWDTR